MESKEVTVPLCKFVGSSHILIYHDMHTLSKTIMYFGLCGYFSSRNFYCLQLPILLKILKATIIKAYSLVVPLLHAGSLASYLQESFAGSIIDC